MKWMVDEMNRILYTLIHGNVDRDFYINNVEELRTRNVLMLKLGFSFATITSIVLFYFASTAQILENVKTFYMISTIWFCVWEVLTFTILAKKHKYAKYFYGVFASSILLMASLTGTLFSPDNYAVVYFVFLIFIPGLYVNRPVNCILTTIASGFVFTIMVFCFKSNAYLISVDIINMVFSIFIGIVFNLYSINMQLENIQSSVNLKKQSITDDLTKMPNRRSFNNSIAKYFEKSLDKDMIIYMMDIDYFKMFNDTYGHVKGDECLASVAKSLVKTAEEYGIFIARYGGEEFIAVDIQNSNQRTKEIARAFVENVKALKIPNALSHYQHVTLSVGYASRIRSEAKNYIQLINSADAALYEIKRNGRNRACEFGA